MDYKKSLLISILFLSIFLYVGVLWAASVSNQIDENTMNQLKRVFAGADSIERFTGVLPESNDGIVILSLIHI